MALKILELNMFENRSIWSKIDSELVVFNFDVVNLGVENGTENFGARYVRESLDLVKI